MDEFWMFVLSLLFAYFMALFGYWQVGDFALGAIAFILVGNRIAEAIERKMK